MEANDTKIFKNKKLSNLLEDIYKNSMKKSKDIDKIINELRLQVTDISDVINIAPVIADFLDVSVKNDEHLIKLATVIQRIISAEGRSNRSDDGISLTPEERLELLAAAKSGLQDVGERIQKNTIPPLPNNPLIVPKQVN